MDEREFFDKVVVITGAGQGQGEHLARRFYDLGSKVALIDLNANSLENVIRSVSPKDEYAFKAYPLNVIDSNAVSEAIDDFGMHWGKIDILVNNAGVLHKGRLEETTDEHIDLMIDVNLKGPMYCTRAVVKYMKEKGGTILNVASILATFPNTGAGAYGAAKAGMILLTKVWAAELAPYHIRVNCYAPGTIKTPMMDEIFAQHREESKLSQIPMREFGEVEDTFKLVSFLCSSRAHYINAQTIGLDGGIWATQTPTASWKK